MLPTASPVPVWTFRSSWLAATLPSARGRVLDVGAGEGDSLSFLPADSVVTLLEPDRRAVRRLRSRAARHRAAAVVRSGAEDLPFDDETFDVAVCCMVLCSVSEQTRALASLHRVLRPGGRLVLLEHVAAPRGTGTRVLQHAVAPVSRALQRGCDPRRATGAAIRGSPFESADLTEQDLLGPFGLRLPHVHGTVRRAARGAAASG